MGLTEHFHRIKDAWDQIKELSNRKRCIELLNLLDLQNELLAHLEDLETLDDQGDHSHLNASDGHVSSDADEDLPNVGIRRRQTVLKKGSTAAHRSDGSRTRTEDRQPSAIKSLANKVSRFQSLVSSLTPEPETEDSSKSSDYFTERRQKTKKLRKREYEAFQEYRNAKIAFLEAEKNMEELEDIYREAKFRREYFERTPKETTERMRSFARYVGAVRAFGAASSRRQSLPDVSYGIMSPVAGSAPVNQFLIPENTLQLQRRKTMHRRGWSSDISGDQTSSDEDSSGPIVPRGNSPPGRWMPINYSRKARENIYGAPTAEDHPVTGERSDSGRDFRALSRTDTTGGFKVVIRPPTGFTGVAGANDSSDNSISRPPSPQYHEYEYQETRFMLVPTPAVSDLFGNTQDRRARSPGPSRRDRSSSPHLKDGDNNAVLVEELQFAFKPSVKSRHQYVPMQNVHLLSKEDEHRMLASGPNAASDPGVLLHRLNRLDPEAASNFIVKGNIIEHFNFRLVYNRPQSPADQRDTFIALSYRRRLHVERHETHYTLPLDPEIFQAVWDERSSDSEGIWIDQISIDQDSEHERTVSMSAMDMVYRSARLIVVALDDILLEAHEGELLQNHMDEYNSMHHVAPRQRFRRKQPAYLETHESLFQTIRKVLRSSWFVRAWCRHEMRLAKNHVFLVPCKRVGHFREKDVLRFNGKCIAHLLALSTEVPFESEIESIKPALHAFFSDRSKANVKATDLRSHHGNFSTVIAEVFAMEAGGDPRIPAEQRQSDARKDKIAIILNTMECGLTLHPDVRQPSTHISDNECFHNLLLLALAARDPGALSSVGSPLPFSDQCFSWLFAPTVADAGLNNYRTLPRLPADAEIRTRAFDSDHYVQLELKFLKPSGDLPTGIDAKQDGKLHMYIPSQDSERLELARKFINVCGGKKWGRNRKRYLLNDRKVERLFGSMADTYAETLAAVFYCGPSWLDEVCRRYSMGRWKVELAGAWRLLVALQNTDGRWPEQNWDEGPAGFIMDFVNFLVIRGLPVRQVIQREPWRPICVSTGGGGKVLTFIPTEHRFIRTAVPKVLVHEDYVHLARMWILQPRRPEHQRDDLPLDECHEWTLLGKSVVFSDEKSIEQMNSFHGDYREHQKVYGRSRLVQGKEALLGGQS